MTSKDSKLTDKPQAMPEVSPYARIKGSSDSIANKALKLSKAEEVQQSIRELDQILKDLAELQKEVGQKRTLVGRHAASLRQISPKGRPEEGEVRTLKGRSMIFVSGTWYSYGDQAPQTKE